MFNAVNLWSDPSGRMLTPGWNRAFERGLIIWTWMAEVSVTNTAPLCLCAFYGKDGDACALERFVRKSRRADSDWECQCRTWWDGIRSPFILAYRRVLWSHWSTDMFLKSDVVRKVNHLHILYKWAGVCVAENSPGLNALTCSEGTNCSVVQANCLLPWFGSTWNTHCKSIQSYSEPFPLSCDGISLWWWEWCLPGWQCLHP